MDALLRFCQSPTGVLILIVLFYVLILLLGGMMATTGLRWLIRFVKDSWG